MLAGVHGLGCFLCSSASSCSKISSGVAVSLPLLTQPNNHRVLILETSQLVFAQCIGGRSGFLHTQMKSNLQLKDCVRAVASVLEVESP